MSATAGPVMFFDVGDTLVDVGESPAETAAARAAGLRVGLVPPPPDGDLSGVRDAVLKPGP